MNKTLALCVVVFYATISTCAAQSRAKEDAPASTATARVHEGEEGRANVPPVHPNPSPDPATSSERNGDATPGNADAALAESFKRSESSRLPELVKPPEPTKLQPPRVDKLDLLFARRVTEPADEPRADATDNHNGGGQKFRWGPAVRQSLLFLAVQHGYAMTQPKTRRDLRGPFFRDYFRSVKSLHGWEDGGRFFTNYIAHPLEGSLVGFIQIHNDPKGMRQRFGKSGDYWRSRMKALAWSAAWSTQFEIGPVSQASIGNVGLHGKQTYVDLVVTPTVGLGLLVAEDALDKHLVKRIERRTDNYFVKIASRMLLNPSRSIANLLRFKTPWHRDAGLR